MSSVLFDLVKNKAYKDEEIQEISLNSSGKKTNWIFDFKNLGMSKLFLEEFSKSFWEAFESSEYDDVYIGGMETGAISLVSGISLFAPTSKNVVPFYIRKSRKKSDLANLIEGDLGTGKPIILVDDIINNGRTFRKQIQILEDQGFAVSAIFTCLRFRDMAVYQDLLDKNIKIISIFELNDFKEVLPVANLKDVKQDISHIYKYSNVFKLALTDKPNLYVVVPKSGPVIAGDYIYLGSDDGSFFCLNKSDGSIIWQYKVLFGSSGKRIFSTPVIYRDRVMFGAYDGNLYCLNKNTGETDWVFFDADWIGSSPCIDQDKGVVFIGLEFGLFKKRGGVVAIDIKTGKALWKNYTMTGLTHASPAYCDGVVVCGCNDNFMYAFNSKTGEIIWKFETKGEVKYSACFDKKMSYVIFGSMDGGLYVLNYKNGELYHKFEALFGFYSTPAIEGVLVIIGSLDKYIYCFNLETKEIEWKFETNGRIFASPVIDKNSIFLGSNDGTLYELETKTGEVVSKTQFSERIVNRIIVERDEDGKRILFVPTHACELYKMVENNLS